MKIKKNFLVVIVIFVISAILDYFFNDIKVSNNAIAWLIPAITAMGSIGGGIFNFLGGNSKKDAEQKNLEKQINLANINYAKQIKHDEAILKMTKIVSKVAVVMIIAIVIIYTIKLRKK